MRKRKEEKIEGENLVKEILNFAWEKKAHSTKVLIMKGIVTYVDYFIILSGNSMRHVRSIADFIEIELKKKKILPFSIEGYSVGKWILMDYRDVIVHIFYKPVREIFQLESLWMEVPLLEVEEPLWIKKIKEQEEFEE